MDLLLKKYKALSQICRLRIVHILLKADTPLCICEMMDIIQKEQYQISRCLGILKKASLVTEDRDGRLLLCSLDDSDLINKHLFKSILNSGPSKIFADDIKRLDERLALRENGKVVVTYND